MPRTLCWPLLLVVTAVAGAAPVNVPELDALEIVAVVDNFYDAFQKDEKGAKRVTIPAAGNFDGIRLQAEMGLAYLITATVAGKRHTLLMDFGLSPGVYMNNLKRLRLDISRAEAMVLSHGHEDHYGGMSVALKQVRAPLFVGGLGVFLPRKIETPAGSFEMGALSREAIEKAGVRVVIADRPTPVANVGLLSGEIPRTTGYEQVPPALKVKKDGEFTQDLLSHEVALVFRIHGKGLVVITSCAHAGVVNTVEHAKTLTGESHVLAIVGGMHLTTASEETIAKTVTALQKIRPEYVAPMHCTGNRALMKLAAVMPDAYIHPSVGTRYRFEGGGN
jgi:7,8-dihydropterin-6-yl-methyl-4-(beta-D-ribofuranosyl)aminobenzene 5'-phosphate synthase